MAQIQRQHILQPGKTAFAEHMNDELNNLVDAHNELDLDVLNHKNRQVDPASSNTTRDKHVSNNDIKVLHDNLATHKTSSDHDTRYYTKTQNDSALGQKADKATTYTKTESDARFTQNSGDHAGTWRGLVPSDFDSGQQAIDLEELKNRIGDTATLQTSSKIVVGAVNELFTSVSDGKAQLETAITDKDGTVSKQGDVATFDELDQGIRSIPQAKGNASRAVVLAGKTFSSEVAGVEQTGTMVDRGAVNQTITTQNGQYTIPQGYHSGTGRVTANFANLTPANVKQGVNIGGVVGTYTERFTPGDNIIASANNYKQRNGNNNSTYYKVKEIRIPLDGVYRIRFSLSAVNPWGSHAGGRVYRNGQPFGINRHTTSANFVIFSEDLEFQKGDLCQLYYSIWGSEEQVATNLFTIGIANLDILMN